MQALPPTSQQFTPDQQHDFVVTYYDTPFPVLHGGVASAGMVFDLREPGNTGSWTTFANNLAQAAENVSCASVFADNTNSYEQVSQGRLVNAQGYWAAGAPGHHGATVNGAVAYHLRGYLRSTAGRAWFSSATTPSWFLAVAGSGWVRVDKVVSGVVTTIFNQRVSERDYLVSGFAFSDQIADMQAGDYLDIYYVESGIESWGGFVFKAVLGTKSATDAANQTAAVDAPVLGCGLLDDGAPPTGVQLPYGTTVEVQYVRGKPRTASLGVPLVTSVNDSIGYQWSRNDASDPGYLSVLSDGASIALHRNRLVTITEGFANEQYTVFTGLLEDFSAPQRGAVSITFSGFEQLLLNQFDKNYPDVMSYMTRGYRSTSGVKEPVYGIQAYDNWPVEYSVSDLFVRSGFDDAALRVPLTVPLEDGTTATVAGCNKFRSKTLGGALLKLERPVHYGNGGAGFNEATAADDPYIFPPQPSNEIWKRVQDLTDRIGYDVYCDEFGDVTLVARNNPYAAYDLSTSDATGTVSSKVTPSAYAASYLEFTGATAGITKQVVGARIDLCVPVGPSLGSWSYTVTRASDSATVASGIVSPATSTEAYFYDLATSADGSNATVVTLFTGDYGTYNVALTASGGSATRRVDCLFTYHTDPEYPRYPQALSTDTNVIDLQASSVMGDMRNSVLVVGRRKASVTDSAKVAQNPQNPSAEFVVARVVDKASITDPTAENYIGTVRESVIYDNSITDAAYAQYLARVFVYRYRMPRPPVQAHHTLLPVVQPRDPVFVDDTEYNTVTYDVNDAKHTVMFVETFTHSIDAQSGQATTTVGLSALPQFPAFEPREDLDLSTFGDNAVVNVSIQYTSLMGDVRTNETRGVPHLSDERYSTTQPGGMVVSGDFVEYGSVFVAGSPEYLALPSDAPWPPIPGSVFISPVVGSSDILAMPTVVSTIDLEGESWWTMRPGTSAPDVKLPYLASQTNGVTSVNLHLRKGGNWQAFPDPSNKFYYTLSDDDTLTVVGGLGLTNTVEITGTVSWHQGEKDTRMGWVTNTPYHHYFNVDYRDSNKRLYLVWNQGDGSAAYQRNTRFTAYSVRYRKLGPVNSGGTFVDPYSGGSPFYDSYTSELGYFVNFTADFLGTGLYRVSVRSVYDDTIVAWLTEPSGDAHNDEAHWSYFYAQAGVTLSWDGIDQVGSWNNRQSRAYAQSVRGVFDPQYEVIGAGFYAWNREYTKDSLAPMALISGLRDANTGAPVFGQGTFSEWYVHVEFKNDTYDDGVVTRTDELDSAYNGGSSEAIIYTHLPEPTKAELGVADWISASDYDSADTNTGSTSSGQNPSNWSTGIAGAPSTSGGITEAVINNQSPVRIRFKVQQRPGPLWTSDNYGLTSIKLNRQVHLRINLFDQFVVSEGKNWPGSSFEQRAIYNRRLTNDKFTLSYNDTDYRRASSLVWNNGDPGTEWIFTPDTFKTNFRGYEESIQFCDYLQLEEVPGWDDGTRTDISSARSRLQLALMNYLFYLSAYTTDRSGRSVWATNQGFVDKSKITTNTYGDWWNPTAPGTAATSGTYRAGWPDDPMTQHRRSVIVRQWSDEGTWQADQRALWGFTAGSLGDQLLRHRWKDHAPSSSSINGVAWSTLGTVQDNYTKWHGSANGFGISNYRNVYGLPSSYNTYATTRQLPSLGSWTWETNPTWAPSILRDFHGYFMVPPMPVGYDEEMAYCYFLVDDRKLSDPLLQVDLTYKYPNLGHDFAAGQVWSSPVWDQTQTYVASKDGLTRFWPGHAVATDQEPVKSKGIGVNVVNYVRQDESIHYEDLRGMYSRGSKPQEAPVKVAPTVPYYQNQYTYDKLSVQGARFNDSYPAFAAEVTNWFSFTFRNEYIWESANLFPVTQKGTEHLEYYNAYKTRFFQGQELSKIAYDGGAWVGWKDDSSGSSLQVEWALPGSRALSAFETDWQTAAVGPSITGVTTDAIFHLVLVSERRGSAI